MLYRIKSIISNGNLNQYFVQFKTSAGSEAIDIFADTGVCQLTLSYENFILCYKM